jgi:hypothetical protein
MPVLTKKKAVEVLSAEIRRGEPHDLVEIHNELFPRQRINEEVAERDPAAVSAKIFKHIEAGLEIEEILDLWNVIFPRYPRRWYDEVNKKLHFEKAEDTVETE